MNYLPDLCRFFTVLSKKRTPKRKACYETEYWLELAQKAEIVSEESVKMLLHDCGSIRRMLIASISTTKDNLNKTE